MLKRSSVFPLSRRIATAPESASMARILRYSAKFIAGPLGTPREGGVTASYALSGFSEAGGSLAGAPMQTMAPFNLPLYASASAALLKVMKTTGALTSPPVAWLQPMERIGTRREMGLMILAESAPRYQACGTVVVSRWASMP